MSWWLWVIIGLGLLVSDIALINIYYLVWFGIGAVLTGVILIFLPEMILWQQMILFTILSVSLLLIWLYAFRPRINDKLLQEAKEELPGMNAIVIKFAHGKGTIRLQRPVCGKDIWSFTTTLTPRPGDNVTISSLNKNGIVLINEETNSSTVSVSTTG